MIYVLILKANIQLFKELMPKLVFSESTENTCTFKISEAKFQKLLLLVRAKGYNPFSVMSW